MFAVFYSNKFDPSWAAHNMTSQKAIESQSAQSTTSNNTPAIQPQPKKLDPTQVFYKAQADRIRNRWVRSVTDDYWKEMQVSEVNRNDSVRQKRVQSAE